MTDHTPGTWYGAVAAAGIALVPASVPVEVVRQIWSDLRIGRGIGALIDGLAGAFGTSLSQLPHFAVLYLEPDGSTRVALRGPVEARVWIDDSVEPSTTTGLGVATWNERTIAAGVRGELVLPGTAAEPLLPVTEGIVLAGRLSMVFADVQLPVEEPPMLASDPAPIADFDPGEGAIAQTASEDVPAAESPAKAPKLAEPALLAPEAEESAGVSIETAIEPVATDAAEPSPPPPVMPEEVVRDPRQAETVYEEAVPTEYDQLLFGETVLSSVESAAVRESEEAAAGEPATPASAPASGLIDGVPAEPANAAWDDHDGETVLVDDLLAARAAAPSLVSSVPLAPASVAKLIVPGHAAVNLDRSAVIGTRPKFSRVQGGNAPHLVAVESPSGEISRSHVEVRLEGASILAVDLNSTNGTMLLREGKEPLRLQPRDPQLLVGGDRLDLGDGVVLSFEGLA